MIRRRRRRAGGSDIAASRSWKLERDGREQSVRFEGQFILNASYHIVAASQSFPYTSLRLMSNRVNWCECYHPGVRRLLDIICTTQAGKAIATISFGGRCPAGSSLLRFAKWTARASSLVGSSRSFTRSEGAISVTVPEASASMLSCYFTGSKSPSGRRGIKKQLDHAFSPKNKETSR